VREGSNAGEGIERAQMGKKSWGGKGVCRKVRTSMVGGKVVRDLTNHKKKTLLNIGKEI